MSITVSLAVNKLFIFKTCLDLESEIGSISLANFTIPCFQYKMLPYFQ